jgi:hypothetical protein
MIHGFFRLFPLVALTQSQQTEAQYSRGDEKQTQFGDAREHGNNDRPHEASA